IPTHESEQRRRLSPPAARAAPPASPRPFPQPDPSPQSPSSVTSLCRVLACKVAAPTFVPRRVIGFRYGTCYRLKVQLVCKLHCFHLWHLLYPLNSLCLLRVAFTLSKLVLLVIGSPAQFRDRFRSLSNVNLSGSQNASKNAAAAAEKTE